MDQETRDLIRDLRRSATDLAKLLGRTLGRRRTAVAIPADAVARWGRQAPDAWAAARAWFGAHEVTVIVTNASAQHPDPAPTERKASGEQPGWSLVVVRHPLPRGSRPVYTLSLFQPGQLASVLTSSECLGDVTLIRALEHLVHAPEVRLSVLQRVCDQGYAAVDDLPAPPDHHRRRYSTVGRTSAREPGPEPPLDLAEIDEIVERVAAFLREGQARQFCHTCLAGLFALSFDAMRKVTTVLRVFNEFRIDTGICLACHKRRMTIRASRPASSGALGAETA